MGVVYVALSGGVDSSVAALLLKKQGFSVVGVFMKPWQTPGVQCLWQKDRQDALRVAAKLGIPLLTWDFAKEYGEKVAEVMIAEYRRGRTPNPDVLCNKHIKFGLFYKRAMQLGADYVATGHYARITKSKGVPFLAKAKDHNKDQTYFLWAIPPTCLKKTLFPIGHLLKSQVRILAAQAGLITADKKDSQGVCFVGDIDFKAFLVRHIKPKPGNVIHVDGRIIGRHDGAQYYTIGQRHGLALTDGGGPYYVVKTDIRRNSITVGGEADLYSKKMKVTKTNWFGKAPRPGDKVHVKIRYRTEALNATMRQLGQIVLHKPARAVAVGQSAVIYRGTKLLGGGILAPTPNKHR